MAAMQWLAESNTVDMDRVAVVGASIGAKLAVVAAGTDRFDVRTVVAISAKTSAVHKLAARQSVNKLRHFLARCFVG